MLTHYRLIPNRPKEAKPPQRYTYSVKAKVRVWSGTAMWYFATLPVKTSKEIKNRFGFAARGWGSLPVSVRLGESEWTTSIFPDKKAGAYVLPLKANIRKRENVRQGNLLRFQLTVG